MEAVVLRAVLTVAFFCVFCCCQDVHQIKLSLLHTMTTKLDNLSKRLEDMDTQMNSKLQELKTDLDTIKEKESRNQTKTLSEVIKNEFDKLNESLRECSSKDQLSKLQQQLLTDVDECKIGVHTCPSNAQCTNTAGSFTCSCHAGFIGNGSFCEDIDECSTGKNRCSNYSHCNNTEGGHVCTCQLGYHGDGFTCEAIPCASPSQIIDTLGCVTLIKVNLSWENAKTNCLDEKARLLQGINSQEQLNQLKERFADFFDGKNGIWLGIYEWQWIEKDTYPGGEDNAHALDVSSPLWGNSEPDQGTNKCSYVYLPMTDRPFLGDIPCDNTRYSFCQNY